MRVILDSPDGSGSHGETDSRSEVVCPRTLLLESRPDVGSVGGTSFPAGRSMSMWPPGQRLFHQPPT